MDAFVRQAGTVYAGVRALVGAALLVAPGPASRNLIGDVADTPGAQSFIRGFGARDVILGLALLRVLRRRDPSREWLLWSGLCGLTDFTATLLAREALPRPTEALAFAGSDMVSGLALAALASR